MSTKAVIYARVSSREQADEGYSIESQQKLLRRFAEDRGYEITAEFVDVESAKTSGREQFKAMLAHLRRHTSVTTILCEKTDRLYRNFHDYIELDVDGGGLTLVLVKENVVLSKESRSHEKLVHGFKVLLAKNYIDNLKEETAKGLLEKAEQGWFPQQAPVGYRNNKAEKTIEPDPAKAAFIRRLFELFASGTYTIDTARAQITMEGLRSRTGRILSRSEIHHILSNPIYYGVFRWQGARYDGKHEPIIDRPLFDAAQAAMKRHNKPRKTKHDFPFRGLLTCGRCGCAYTAELKKGKYVYYRCTTSKGNCSRDYIRQEDLDEKLAAAVKAIHIDKDVIDEMLETMRESHGQEKAYHDAAVASLQAEYRHLQGRIDKAYEDKLDGRITEDFWKAKTEAWRTAQEKARGAIAAHEKANQAYFEQGADLLRLASRMYDLYRVRSLSEKRQLLDLVTSNFTVTGKCVVPVYKKPFDILVEGLACPNGLPRLDNLRNSLQGWLRDAVAIQSAAASTRAMFAASGHLAMC